jgi:hypothetical protein
MSQSRHSGGVLTILIGLFEFLDDGFDREAMLRSTNGSGQKSPGSECYDNGFRGESPASDGDVFF